MVLAMFYRVVEKSILLYGLETWVLSAEMENKVEGAHIDFLREKTGKKARQISDRTQEMPRAGVVQEEEVKKLSMTYIGR